MSVSVNRVNRFERCVMQVLLFQPKPRAPSLTPSCVTPPAIRGDCFVYTRAVLKGGEDLWQRSLRDIHGFREGWQQHS
jgi:hypothetical protein